MLQSLAQKPSPLSSKSKRRMSLRGPPQQKKEICFTEEEDPRAPPNQKLISGKMTPAPESPPKPASGIGSYENDSYGLARPDVFKSAHTLSITKYQPSSHHASQSLRHGAGSSSTAKQHIDKDCQRAANVYNSSAISPFQVSCDALPDVTSQVQSFQKEDLRKSPSRTVALTVFPLSPSTKLMSVQDHPSEKCIETQAEARQSSELPVKKSPKKKQTLVNKANSPAKVTWPDAAPIVLNQKKIIINTSRSEYPVIDEVAREVMGWRVSKQEDPSKFDYDLWWSDLGIESHFLSALKCYQMVNHFPAMYQLARKTFLARNLRRLQKLFPMEFNFFPRTWCLPKEMQTLRFAQEQAAAKLLLNPQVAEGRKSSAYKRKSKQTRTRMAKVGFTMICKPDNQSQGKGIFLTQDVDAIPLTETNVVQEYLSNPFLVDGLKCDMRLYVLVLSCEPLKVYIHREGLVRFATKPYVPIEIGCGRKTLESLFSHLTNYSLNRENTEFRAPRSLDDPAAHKRTLTQFFRQLRAEYEVDVDRLWAEMKDIIIKSLLTVQPDLAHNYRTCQPSDAEGRTCFELLGFDIILTSDLKPILLEVNHAPSFATDSPLDYQIKKSLFVDMFRMMGLTLERKREKLRGLQEEKKTRLTTKVSLKERTRWKKEQIDQMHQQACERGETETHGGFERIFPLDLEFARAELDKTNEEAGFSPAQIQIQNQSYQALQQQQNRYNEFLTSIQTFEKERQTRTKIKTEEALKQKVKDEELQRQKTEKAKRRRTETYKFQFDLTERRRNRLSLYQQQHQQLQSEGCEQQSIESVAGASRQDPMARTQPHLCGHSAGTVLQQADGRVSRIQDLIQQVSYLQEGGVNSNHELSYTTTHGQALQFANSIATNNYRGYSGAQRTPFHPHVNTQKGIPLNYSLGLNINPQQLSLTGTTIRTSGHTHQLSTGVTAIRSHSKPVANQRGLLMQQQVSASAVTTVTVPLTQKHPQQCSNTPQNGTAVLASLVADPHYVASIHLPKIQKLHSHELKQNINVHQHHPSQANVRSLQAHQQHTALGGNSAQSSVPSEPKPTSSMQTRQSEKIGQKSGGLTMNSSEVLHSSLQMSPGKANPASPRKNPVLKKANLQNIVENIYNIGQASSGPQRILSINPLAQTQQFIRTKDNIKVLAANQQSQNVNSSQQQRHEPQVPYGSVEALTHNSTANFGGAPTAGSVTLVRRASGAPRQQTQALSQNAGQGAKSNPPQILSTQNFYLTQRMTKKPIQTNATSATSQHQQPKVPQYAQQQKRQQQQLNSPPLPQPQEEPPNSNGATLISSSMHDKPSPITLHNCNVTIINNTYISGSAMANSQVRTRNKSPTDPVSKKDSMRGFSPAPLPINK